MITKHDVKRNGDRRASVYPKVSGSWRAPSFKDASLSGRSLIKKNMEKMMKLQLPFTSEVLYLGKETQEVTRSGGKYLFQILLVSAKKANTRKWLNKDAPSVDNRIEVMLSIYRMKKLTFLMRFKADTFINYWENWVDFVFSVRKDFVK